MHLLLLSSQLKAVLQPIVLLFLLFFLFYSPIKSSKLPTNLSLQEPSNLTLDYGGIFHNSPAAILNPKTTEDISLLLKSIYSSPIYNNITVAPRGAGHSTYGQAQAPGGIVIDMPSLPLSVKVGSSSVEQNSDNISYVDAGGGALWVEVLKETLKHGLAPRSWTDYLYLTVGGTLSVGGISGQTFKYGPQISNVVEMDVVTGKGELVKCSGQDNSDLFYGVLGGLGQFGIITRARIILQHAPRMVKWVRAHHFDFDQFLRDAELLINMEEVDYLEGFVKFDDRPQAHKSKDISSRLSVKRRIKPRQSNVYYLLEMAIYYDDFDNAAKTLDKVLSELYTRSSVEILEVSYFDFLNRVRSEELSLRRRGQWDVPHPWMNLFVPRYQIRRFKDLLLESISDTYIDGPIILYPTLRQKWNSKMSIMVPQDEAGEGIFYVVSVLRSAPPTCTAASSCLDALIQQNEMIISIATAKPACHGAINKPVMNTSMLIEISSAWGNRIKEEEEELEVAEERDEGGMGAKQYMPYLRNEREWREHFGEQWERFEDLKSEFDPLHVLTPGQRIFKRKSLEEFDAAEKSSCHLNTND